MEVNQQMKQMLSEHFSRCCGPTLLVLDFPKGATSARCRIADCAEEVMYMLDDTHLPRSGNAILYLTPMKKVHEMMRTMEFRELEELVQESTVVLAAERDEWEYLVCDCLEELHAVARKATGLMVLDVLDFVPLPSTTRIAIGGQEGGGQTYLFEHVCP